MKNFFVQRLMYATGLDKKILAEHENYTKEVIRKAGERLKANYEQDHGTIAVARKG